MKKVIIFLSVLFIFSCKDSETTKIDFESEISISEMVSYLPSHYKKEKSVYFVNDDQESKMLKISYLEGIENKTHNGNNYVAETFEATLYDPNNQWFSIQMKASANYSNSGNEIVKSISAILMPFNESGTTWASIKFENGVPKISLGDDFRESVLLNNKEYKDVFITIGKQGDVQHEAYSELDINSEVGVVAFRDHNNDLWTFDRFEE